jgi:2-octaprenyl-6-methoxyphenol hydroxylase
MNIDKTHFDIVIAGGGLAGCLMALSLAKSTKANGELLQIAIVEKHRATDNHSNELTFDERVLALSHGTASYFADLGVWQNLSANANPIETIHISDRGYYGKARVYAKDHQVDALGYVAPMKSIGLALQQALALVENSHANNIHWFCPAQIEQLDWLAESVEIKLTSTQTLSAKLLLACDGAQSVCREFANIQTTCKAYGQSAVIANVTMAQAHQNIAYERFTEFGPIALLPLNDNMCSLVWTVTPGQAEQLTGISDEEFIAKLNQAFGFWQGGVNSVSQRFIYPLNLVQADENVYHRMALVGNASHTIHPIAGQGFNLGVRDVSQLATLIAEQLAQNKDIGSFAMLNHYGELRRDDQRQIINLTDSLVILFSNTLPPLVAGRNIALKALNYCQPIKQAFVKKTMGY